jgi:Flp pilus assembly protein TadG
MRRLTDERGAIGVVVALLMVPLLALVAIAVDLAAVEAEQQQLQVGADAAALAVAQGCGTGDCDDPQGTAGRLAALNPGSAPAATVLDPSTVRPVAGEVTVENQGVREHWFAPVIGLDSSVVTARATARWAPAARAAGVLPLAVSLCAFTRHAGALGGPSGVEVTIPLAAPGSTGCRIPHSGAVVPDGVSWLSADGVSCNLTVTVTGRAWATARGAPAPYCRNGHLSNRLGTTVLLPVLDDAGTDAGRGWYRVHALAAFELTGYAFSDPLVGGAPCEGATWCLRGRFVDHAVLDRSATWVDGVTAPDLGVTLVRLTS